jgi:formate dehydrogenase major subunit
MTPIELTLDGVTVHAEPGTTLWEAARAQGVHLPHLCHSPDLRPDGNCRACMVEVEGERVLAASCCRAVSAGMNVHTQSDRATKARALVIELLLADAASTDLHTNTSELTSWARLVEVNRTRFPRRAAVEVDASHPAITVNLDACIQCTRCLRACREEQGNDVIGLALRGPQTAIAFDALAALGASSCVACGECVQACPTGALMPAQGAGLAEIDAVVPTVCPYCGVGCQMNLHVGAQRVQFVTGRDGPANHGRLCVKGRYGFDYVHHDGRLTVPLKRRAGVAKDPADIERVKGGQKALTELFEPVSWDEALDLAAAGLVRIRDSDGGHALAGFGSAKGSNEEAYLFQKLVRQGLHTHNVDHCTRLCHASSVAALLEGIGSGSVSNPVADVAQAKFILLIGANPVVNHPVAATFIKNAVDRHGAQLCIADPRSNALARRARWHLAFKPGTDVALLNALLHVVIDEGLVDAAFIAARVAGYDALEASVAEATPERMSEICGVAPETLREVARAYARADSAMILWGMGISQHVHGTDNARALIALAMITGQIGRPGTGLHPLRGQNNVQGASDAGLIPMMLPDYRRVALPEVRAAFEALWHTSRPLATQPGLTVVEIMHAASAGRIKGLYVEGENPAMSDPDLDHARAAIAKLEHLVVQDIFATETAILADVILPASAHAEKWGSYTNTDRLIQIGRPALSPPGNARQDLWAIAQIARRLGVQWDVWRDDEDGDGRLAREAPVARVYEEMRSAMPPLAGVPWSRLVREDAVTTPAAREDAPGDAVVFIDRFPTADGRAHLVPTTYRAGPETRDADYPFVLTTGRVLEHWHTGAMTRHAEVLDALAPQPLASLHPDDARRLGIADGTAIELATRHGGVRAIALLTPEVQRGQVFMAFAYWEAAANRLTGDALDPVAKIPGFKVTAVKVAAA